MGFLQEFLSGSNDKVNSPTVIGTCITLIMAALAIPAGVLGLWAFYHHVWTLKKGLDGSAVQLIGLLIGGGGVGCGIGYGINRFAGSGRPAGIPPGWKPPAARPPSPE
ncbi:MAG: hypothetical protein M1438_09590 [Deltaproteobacteria bacterium]|nr:hypothetical protein [Deltaproteobacteria bacterium]